MNEGGICVLPTAQGLGGGERMGATTYKEEATQMQAMTPAQVTIERIEALEDRLHRYHGLEHLARVTANGCGSLTLDARCPTLMVLLDELAVIYADEAVIITPRYLPVSQRAKQIRQHLQRDGFADTVVVEYTWAIAVMTTNQELLGYMNELASRYEMPGMPIWTTLITEAQFADFQD